MAINDITACDLRARLSYEPMTGAFTRLRSGHGKTAGEVAGCKLSNGYLQIQVCGRGYCAHRLAWLFVTGSWPKGEIDHINGVKDDNRIANLRDVSTSVNQQNQRTAHRDSHTGFIGISRSRNRYGAFINIGGVGKRIGTFDTPEEAHAAYLQAKRAHHAGCTI